MGRCSETRWNFNDCRFIWIVVHITGLVGVFWLMVTAMNYYTAHATVTTLYDTLYPIEKVPFPGISICNNNRISLRAATMLAHEL